MKNIITILAAVIVAFSATAKESVKPDTLYKNNSTSTMIITEDPDGVTLDIKSHDKENDARIRLVEYSDNSSVSIDQHTSRFQTFSYTNCAVGIKANSHWDAVCGGLNIGLVNALNQPGDMRLQWSKSFEIGWVNAFAVRYSHRMASVSLGIGFDWRNYNTTSHTHYMTPVAAGTGVATVPYPDGVKSGNSRIKVFSLGFPLLYTQRIPHSTLSLTAGGIFNLNTHASLLTHYTDTDGNSIEEFSQNVHRRRFSWDLYGAIKFYNNVGLYVRYSPQSVLYGRDVPKFNPLSVGVTLFM